MWQKYVQGGFWATAGYLLSPLSFWNDLYINIPLAYVFALPFGLISRSLFLPAFVVGYWLTNVLGFILMHKGIRTTVSDPIQTYSRKELVKDLVLSLGYTVFIIILVYWGLLRFPTEYF